MDTATMWQSIEFAIMVIETPDARNSRTSRADAIRELQWVQRELEPETPITTLSE